MYNFNQAEDIILNVTINAAKSVATNKVNVSLLKALKLTDKQIQDIIGRNNLVIDYSDIYEMSETEILKDRSAQMSLYLFVGAGETKAVEKLLSANDNFIKTITVRIINNPMVAADPAVDAEDVNQDCIVELLDILAKRKYDPCKKNKAALSSYAYSTMDKNVFRKNRKGTPLGQSDFFYNCMPKFKRWIEEDGNNLNSEEDYIRCASAIKETVGTVRSLYSRYLMPPTMQSLDECVSDQEDGGIPLVDTLPDNSRKSAYEMCRDNDISDAVEEAMQNLNCVDYIIVKSKFIDPDISYREIANEIFTQLGVEITVNEIKEREAKCINQMRVLLSNLSL